jgi:hypothetical protein
MEFPKCAKPMATEAMAELVQINSPPGHFIAIWPILASTATSLINEGIKNLTT